MIWRQQAVDTLVDTLKKIGLERIPVIGIKHGKGYNLVSKDKRPPVPGRIWQHECDGWYIYSNISNAQKIDALRKISDYYHLDLLIEEGKPNSPQPVTPIEKKRITSRRGRPTNNLVDKDADSVFGYQTAEEVRLCIDILKESNEFIRLNKQKHNAYTAALNKYLQFIEEWERWAKE